MDLEALILVVRSDAIEVLSCLLTGVRDAVFCGSLQRIRGKSEKVDPGLWLSREGNSSFRVPCFLLNFHEKTPSVSKRWMHRNPKYTKISALVAR